MCTVLALRDGLRSGDVFVPGSRRYADPGTYLFTPEQWQPRLAEFCQLVRKPSEAAEAIAQVKDELRLALTDLEETLANSSPNDVGAVRLDSDGKLVIPPLSAEDIPAEAKALRDELAPMLPFVPIASLLIELDARTNFLACFTHAGGRKSAQSVELKSNILAALIAGATNLGVTRMSEACGVSYDTLAWTQEWYVREDTLRDANTVIVNHHYGLELARKFGGGNHVVLGRAAVPCPRQVPHRPRHDHPRRTRPVDLHPRLRPVVDVRDEADRGDPPRGPLHAGRAARQRDRPAYPRARHRHPRRDPG